MRASFIRLRFWQVCHQLRLALLMLEMFGKDLTLIATIGILLLIGIVKKNAIMMIDFALDAQRNRGMNPTEAIREACIERFRPIMMTTLAALVGALPIALGLGAGAELRQPLRFGCCRWLDLLASDYAVHHTCTVSCVWINTVAKDQSSGMQSNICVAWAATAQLRIVF